MLKAYNMVLSNDLASWILWSGMEECNREKPLHKMGSPGFHAFSSALNYIWANKLPIGRAVPNPFTANAMMIAVQSGPSLSGKWVEETRNVFDDYRRYFGTDPPRAGGIAIMTDTNNTGEEAAAWYGPIRILSGPSQRASQCRQDHP
jgi:hypothetical protein